ncbi:hypothetical protein Plhal304r1_c018g0065701 [Plasmopara halstedii]
MLSTVQASLGFTDLAVPVQEKTIALSHFNRDPQLPFSIEDCFGDPDVEYFRSVLPERIMVYILLVAIQNTPVSFSVSLAE